MAIKPADQLQRRVVGLMNEYFAQFDDGEPTRILEYHYQGRRVPCIQEAETIVCYDDAFEEIHIIDLDDLSNATITFH